MRTRKLSLQVTAYSDGQYAIAVIESEFGSRGTQTSKVITQVFADEDQVHDVASQLLRKMVEAERAITV